MTALCFCGFATVPLLLHLHHPERALNVMLTPNPMSAMAEFGFIYSMYMLLLIIEVWLIFRPEIVEHSATAIEFRGVVLRVLSLGTKQMTRGNRAADEWLIHVLAVVGIPAACVLHGYVGFLFGGIKANPWWSTALLPVIFLISAVVSGIAALLLLYLALSRLQGRRADPGCVAALSRYLWISLVVAVSLELLELLHLAYEGGSEWHVLRTLIAERMHLTYGWIQIAIGSVIPILLLPVAMQLKRLPKAMSSLAAMSSVLVIVQVFAMRWNVIIGGQMFSKSFRGFVEYNPTWFGREGLLAAGFVLALPLIALFLASRTLPLWETDVTNESQSPA